MATDKLVAMKIFRRVAELGSFTRAADDLDITAATVSKHIAFLERDLDTRLINRTTRRMNLTGAGLAFLQRTQALLDDLEEAELEARGLLTVSSRKMVMALAALLRMRTLMAKFSLMSPSVMKTVQKLKPSSMLTYCQSMMYQYPVIWLTTLTKMVQSH